VSEKRRNLGILAVVIALMVAALATVAVRGFTLGLDLRGGLEVVLKARPIHGNSVSATDLQNAADVMRKRIDPRGILQPEIRTSTADNTIDISIPGVKDPNAVANLLVAGQLQAFDFYKTLTPVSRVSTYQAKPRSLYSMLTAAKPDLRNDRRSRSSVSLKLRWCNSKSGQFLSSPAHMVSLPDLKALQARLIPLQLIAAVKALRQHGVIEK